VPSITFGTLLRILLASFVVGLAMYWLDVQPRDILGWVTGSVEEVLANAQAWISWTVKYVLLGAVIVVPVWLLSYLFQFLRRR
jgi:Na+/H+-dicarboxylate symporter